VTEMMLSLALSLSHYSIRSIEGVYMSIFMRVNCCCYTLRAKSCGGPMISCMNLSVQDNIHGVLMFPIPLFNISVVSDIPVIALVLHDDLSLALNFTKSGSSRAQRPLTQYIFPAALFHCAYPSLRSAIRVNVFLT